MSRMMRSVALEFLRKGPPHNQLLSPLTDYLALCGNHPAVSVNVPFEHREFLRILDSLRYVPGDHDIARTERLERMQRAIDAVLRGIPSLATYAEDFYAGRPAVTVNAFGDGWAYYIASRDEQRFCDDLYAALAGRLGLARALDAELPEGVSAQVRTDGRRRFVFLMNFGPAPRTVDLAAATFTDVLNGGPVAGPVELAGFGAAVLEAN